MLLIKSKLPRLASSFNQRPGHVDGRVGPGYAKGPVSGVDDAMMCSRSDKCSIIGLDVVFLSALQILLRNFFDSGLL